MRKLLVILAVLMSVAGAANATVSWVRPNGVAAWPGTTAAPTALATANDSVKAGDIVHLRHR